MELIQRKTVTTSKILGLCACKQKTGTLYTSSYWFAVKFHKNFDMNIFLVPKLKVLKFIHYIEYRNHVISPLSYWSVYKNFKLQYILDENLSSQF